MGTAVPNTALAASGTANDLMVNAESGAVTIGGSPADADEIFFNIYRDVSADSQTADARLLGVKIYNLKGEFICDIANGIISEGEHVLSWNGINNKNKNVPSGTYLLIIDNEATFHSQKIILLK